MLLTYRPTTEIGMLDIDECVIKAVGNVWLLAFYVRTTEGNEQTFRVPVNPNGAPVEAGPLGRTWGLTRCGAGEWQVLPSIDLGTWHQTPRIIGVPEGEPWATTG